MASAEGGSVTSGVEYGEGCPLFSRLRGIGELRELPQRGPGQSPGRKRILAYFEGHRIKSSQIKSIYSSHTTYTIHKTK